ncbi:MAG: dihydroorotase [Gammaproteobacteria bacterium]|nr:dihydroorotase [Gammaproteobacteria bacterium]
MATRRPTGGQVTIECPGIRVEYPVEHSTITIIRPDDWHLHLRDGPLLEAVVEATARQFARAIIMPNLKPPVTSTQMAQAYRERILAALVRTAPGVSFEPLMTLYLTDGLSPDEVSRAHDSGIVYAAKLYPAGATTNSDAGVTHVDRIASTLERMQRIGMPLLIHGESTAPDIDVFDREDIFIEQTMVPLRARYPELKIVFEHITTKSAADYVSSCAELTAATITAHHLLDNRNAIFDGGIRPHMYCLPILKRERDRQALVAAATSGDPRFFLGTDSAPHPRADKETACGCAGLFTALNAMELYAEAFEQVGALEKLEAFASLNGPRFYGLAPNEETITLVRGSAQVPAKVMAGDVEIVPYRADEAMRWVIEQ